jgi:WD40 repeat protein
MTMAEGEASGATRVRCQACPAAARRGWREDRLCASHANTHWASPSGRPGRVLSGQGSTVIGLAFSPDGRELGAASGAGAQLWRVTDGALIASLTDNGAGFESVAFSRDGRYFVTGGGDGSVRVWDASTGDPVETFRTHSLAVYRAVFSRQGNLIASASADRTARIDVCDLCESVPALVRLAKEHLPATG